MDRTELLKNYTQLNNSFKKQMTFHLGVEAGFFSEFNNMVLAMIYCLENKIRFSLYSKKANFSYARGWTDFFLPFCEEKTFFLHSRYNRRAYQTRNAKTFPPTVLKLLSGDDYLTQDIWDHFRTEKFAKKKFTIPELNLNNSSLLDATKTIISMIWQYTPQSRKLIEDYKKALELPENFISIHIRAGDKNLEANTFEPHDYIKKAEKLNSFRKAFVLTDNFAVIEKIKNDYKKWEFFTLCSPAERGYIHSEFIRKEKYQKYLQHIKLFAGLDICAASNKFIGTYSSNPGMFMGMRIGEEKCSCIDYSSWVLW